MSLPLQLLKSEEDASYKPAKKACVQLVDNLVEHILKYEESLAGTQLYNPTSFQTVIQQQLMNLNTTVGTVRG